MTATTTFPLPDAGPGSPLGAAKPFVVIAGTAHPRLAAAIATELGVPLGRCRVERFPDGEVAAELQQ